MEFPHPPAASNGEEAGDLDDMNADEGDDDGVLTDHSSDALTRVHVMGQKWTVDEWWAAFMAIKIKSNLADTHLRLMAKMVNAASIDVGAKISETKHGFMNEVERAVPFKPTYVAYCSNCDEVLQTSSVRIRSAYCEECDTDWTEHLQKGKAFFIVYSIREQLENYLRDKRLPAMMRDFLPVYDALMRGREPYTRIIRQGNLSLTLCCDAARLTNRTQASYHFFYTFSDVERQRN